MPDRLVDSLPMSKALQGHLVDWVPHFDGPVHGGTQELALVKMVPLASLYLSSVPFENGQGLRQSHLPELKRAVTSGTEQLLLVSLVKADVEAAIRSLELLEGLQPLRRPLENQDTPGTHDAEVLRLG